MKHNYPKSMNTNCCVWSTLGRHSLDTLSTVSKKLSLLIIILMLGVGQMWGEKITNLTKVSLSGSFNGESTSYPTEWSLPSVDGNEYRGVVYLPASTSETTSYTFKVYAGGSNWNSHFGLSGSQSYSAITSQQEKAGWYSSGNNVTLNVIKSPSKFVKVTAEFWGDYSNNSKLIIWQEAVTALSATLTTNKLNLTSGQTATLTPTPSGGSGSYQTSYTVTDMDGTNVTSSTMSGNTFTAPSAAGVYTITYTVSDAHTLLSGLSSASATVKIIVGGTQYNLINYTSSPSYNTTDFKNENGTLSSGTYTYYGENKFTKYYKFGSSVSLWATQSAYGTKYIGYDVKTKKTTLCFYAHTSSSSDISVHVITEGATTVQTYDRTVSANSNEMVFVTLTNTTNASVFISVKSTNIYLSQIVAIEHGDPLVWGGQPGYSINLNKGRLASNKQAESTVCSVDGIYYVKLGSSYSPLSGTAATIKEKGTAYVKFTTTTPVKLKVTTSSTSKYYVGTTTSATTNETTPTANTATEFELTTAGTWYIIPNGSNVNITKIEFESHTPSATWSVYGKFKDESSWTRHALTDGAYTHALAKNSSYDFKVSKTTDNTSFTYYGAASDGNEYKTSGTEWTLNGNYNVHLKTAAAGNYTINVTPGDYPKITVTYPTSLTVTFDMQGHGTAPATQTNIAPGEKATEPSTPADVEGWHFVGWYKEAACTNVWNFSTDVVKENTTIYAKWVKKITALELSHPTSLNSLYVGDKMQLTLTPTPNDAEYGKEYTWHTSNSSYIDVDKNGVVTAKGVGSGAYITVTNNDNITSNQYIINVISNACTGHWSLHMWNNSAWTNRHLCFTQVGSTHEYRTEQTTLPSNSDAERIKVLYDNADGTHTKDWPTRYVVTNGYRDGNCSDAKDGDRYPGQDAIGYFRMYDNSELDNYWLSFEPIYAVRYGSGDSWQITNFTNTETKNNYYTDLWQVPSNYTSINIYAGARTSSNVNSIGGRSKTVGMNTITGLTASDLAGKYGKFKINDNYCNETNFNLQFIRHYQMSYNANTGTGDAIEPQYISSEATGDAQKVKLANCTFTKTGYHFDGWYTNAECTGTKFNEGSDYALTSGTGDVVMYAKWTENLATITLAASPASAGTFTIGGAAATEAQAGVATKPEVTAVPATGYDFTSWAITGGSHTISSTSDNPTTITGDGTTTAGTLTATFTAKTYSITYKDQGDVAFSGNHESGAPTQYTYGVGVQLKSASKNGYTFGGWFLESDCSGTAVKTIGTDAHENKTLFAKWTAKTYQVTLSDIDGNGATANITVTYGQECPDAQIKALTISKTGYTWNGFKTEGGTKIIKYEEDKYKFESSVDGYTASALWKRDGGATFTAMWTALSVKSIAVKTAPTKTTYTAGENFDPTGLVITKTMSDNSTVDVAYSSESSNFSFNPSTSLTAGTTSVTITYGGKTTTQAITVTGGGSVSSGCLYKYNDALRYQNSTYMNPEGKSASTSLSSAFYLYLDNGPKTSTSSHVSGIDGLSSVKITGATLDNKSGTNYKWITAYIKIPTGGDATSKNIEFTTDATHTATVKMKLGGYNSNPTVSATNATKTSGTIGGKAETENNYNEITYTIAKNTTAYFTFSGANTYISEINVETQGSSPTATYTVTVAKNESTYGTVSQASVANVASGTSITFGSTGALAVGSTNVTASPATQTAQYTYTFDGWNSTDYTTGGTVTKNGTVTANFSRATRTYTLSFNSKGGSSVASQTIAYNGHPTAVTDPTRTGYNFAGWSETDGGTVVADITTLTITGNKTLYAKWTADSYTITYNGNGNTSGTVPANTVGSGNVNLAANSGNLAKTDYTFGGWNTKANGTGTTYAAGALYNLSADVTLYAKWNSTGSGTKFSLVMKNNLTDESLKKLSSRELTSDDATITGGTATIENVGNSDDKMKIKNSNICFDGSDGLLILHLSSPIAEGDVITFTNNQSVDKEICFTKEKSRSSQYLTSNKTYTIPSGSPLIGCTTVYVWRASGSTTYIKTINVAGSGSTTYSVTASATPAGYGTIATSGTLTGLEGTTTITANNVTANTLTVGTATITPTATTATSQYSYAFDHWKVNGTELAKGSQTAVSAAATVQAVFTRTQLCTAPTISWNVTPTAIAAVGGTCSASVTTNYADGVTWSASPSGKVTFSSTTGASTTITATATGQVTITAKVLGADGYCAEEKSVQATITIGGATGGHVITHATPTNGTFDVLLNGEHTTSANKGQLIALTATPASSYTFYAWDVYKTGESSTKITVTNNTFIMPDYDVTVQATFKTKGGESGCYAWGYGEKVTTVPTTNNDVTVDNRLVLKNHGNGAKELSTVFSGSSKFTAISLHGREEFVEGNLGGAEITSVTFSINTSTTAKDRCFVAFCNTTEFKDDDTRYLIELDDQHHNAKYYNGLPATNGTRKDITITAPAGAKSFAITRNFQNFTTSHYSADYPESDTTGWMPSAYRYLYHLEVCGGASAAVAVAPIGIVRDTTITCGTSTAIKLTAYGSLENGNTWYWQTTETGTSTTHQGATFEVTRAGTYYVRSRCVNPSDANDVSWSVARSITVPVSAWTALPEISDLCGSTSGAATINYTVGQAASKLYVEASNTSSVVWYSNTSASTTGGTKLCDGVLSGGKYYTEDAVSTTAVSTQYYYCEIFNGTCAVTSPLVTVDVKAATGYNKFSLVMKDQLADQSVAGKTSMAISSSLATISGGTAALENLSSAAGKAQIVNDHLYLASSDGLVVVNLNYPLAEGDKIVITNRIADNANQYALTATKERNTEIVTEDGEYTIPAGSPLIGIKTLYIWRSTTAITYIKTINVKCDAQPSCQGPTFTSISANHTTIGKGSSVTLTAAATASGALTYQWYKADGTSAGAAGAQLTLSNMQSTTSYYCVATEAGCATPVKSTGITINVTECATPTISWATAPANLTVGEGNGEATVNTNRPAGVVYTWAAANSTSGAVELSGDGTGKVTIIPVTAGTVRITATVTGDGAVVCDGSASVYQDITINPALEKYTIGYDLDEGTAGTGAPTIANRNEWVEIPNPTKSGFDFAGWTVSSGLDVTNGYWNTTNSSTGQDKIEYPCKVCYNATGNVYIYNAGANGQSIQLTAKWYQECNASGTSIDTLFKYKCSVAGAVGTAISGGTLTTGEVSKFATSTYTSCKFAYKMDAGPSSNNTKYWKITLSGDETLQTGDKINIKGYITSSPGATYKLGVYKALGGDALGLYQFKAKTTEETYTYVVDSDLNGENAFYIQRGAGSSVYASEVFITRGGSGASCHHVIYHASYSDATGVTNDDQSYGSSDKATIKQCGFTRAGYDFVGWNTTKGATTKMDEYDPGDEVTLSADLVLYAVWKESQATAPNVNWTDVPATVYPGMQFTFTVTTDSDDPNLSVASLTATANATLINKSISGKTITATCQINAATNSNPVLTLTTAGTSAYRSSVSTQSPTLQTCAGSGYQTIFSYTAKTTETALGTYAANGGTATLSGKAMNGNDVLTVNEQNYIQMRAGSNWVFTLDGNATFQAGDEITFTFASNDSVDRRTGVDLYMSLFNTNVPYGETASITYILQSASDDVSERIIGTNQLMMERANQFMKFGSITVRRATIGQTSIQAPTLEFWDAVGDSVIPVGHTVNKKVDAIPFTIYAKSNSSGEITYASYDIGVAIVNPETGEVSKPIAGGQTVITATIAANGCYNAKTIYYALVVDSTDCGIIPHLDNPLPTDQTATLGETVSFTVVASNADTYQWYSCDNTEEDNTEVIPGANSATYSFTATEVGKKFYFCKVSSSCRSVVKTEPRFAQINPLPYTITYTAGVQDGTTYTEATFTDVEHTFTTEPDYITNLSNYFFINGAAIHGAANGTMSSTIDIPMSRTETNYTGFNFNVLESYYLTVDSIKLNVAAVGTTGIQVQAILSDNHDHAISSAIKTITEGVDQSVAIEFPNLDVQLVDQVTMKILAWYDDANAYIRIGETTGIDGKIHSLPEPTIYWTSVPKDGTAGKDMLIAAESNITISDITYTSSNTAVATISDVEDVDAKRLRYVAAGTSTISASIKGDGVSYFAKTVTISQPITVVAAAQNTFTVTCFTSDGSKIYATYTQKTQGEELSFTEPVNQGYTFAGWYEKDGIEPLIEPGQTFAPTQDTSVYAHWNAITYNITYNLNGGTNYQGAPATYTIETPDIELGTPTRDGFTFLGWYNNADFTGDVITTISTGNYGAINLFARWKEQSESSCIDYGTWLFENNMTVGQKPAHAVSTTATTFSAFAVDQINFSSQKITYESGTGEFGGWKINTKGATITFCVDNNCAVSIRVGQLKSAMSITYIDADGKSQTTNLTANTTNAFIVSGETTVTLTTAGSSTVVLKEITVTDPCYIEPAYTVKRQHFGPTETVDQTEIGSINLAGAGVTYTLKETINGEGYGLTASFDAENGKMYIAGTTSNTSGKTQTLNITYVFQNDCSTKRAFEVTIPVDIYAGNPKLAYIIDGEKDGDFTDYNQSHAEGTALFEKLKQNFDVYAVNCYATVDETEIYNYYKDYDILLMTDYPNTSITKTINKKKYSYSNAVGCMVDKKPILTFETFVADLDNWHIDSNPKSPEGADATNQMTLLCNANDILKTADFNVGKKVTMATQLPSPSLQGFEPKDAPDFVFIATIPRYSSPDSTKLLITCCERQTNIKARMMVLGMQSNTYEVISDSGYMVVCGLLKYLLLDDNIPDCSLIFHGQTSNSWQTAANWEGNTIPSDLSPVRIDAPCVVDITSAKAGTVKINQKLNDEEVQLHGSLTINSDAALTVTKFVRTMTVETPEPHATAVSDLHILSTATGNGALIFDNANGDTKATVNYYSISAGESNGNGGLQNAKWQWMTTPYNDVKDVQHNYYGAWMRRYDNATHKWIDMYNGCSMTPFSGYELTQYGATTYEMQGTLATTANQTITLAPYLNVIGNSWTAPINISQFTTDDFTNAEATIVMLNTGLDEKGTGSVTTVDAKTADVRTAGTYVSIPINVASEIPQYKVIPSMQSFQIRAGGEGGSLTLNYDKIVRTASPVIQPMRAPGRATGEQNEENGINERLRIYVQGNNYGDYIYLFQHDGTTMDFDNGWDGRKFRSSNLAIPTLMARSGTDNWHISTQPQFAGTQIAFYQGEDNFYTIGFSYSGYETLWFYDNVTDQYTEINNENTYVFTSNTTKLQKRFEIRDYNPNAIVIPTKTDEMESSQSSVQKVILQEKLYILTNGHVYNAQGKQVK